MAMFQITKTVSIVSLLALIKAHDQVAENKIENTVQVLSAQTEPNATCLQNPSVSTLTESNSTCLQNPSVSNAQKLHDSNLILETALCHYLINDLSKILDDQNVVETLKTLLHLTANNSEKITRIL